MLKVIRASLSLRRRRFEKEALWRWHHTSLTNDLIENMDKKATWDRFYTENGKGTFKNFEWFFGFHAIKDCILPLLQTTSSNDAPLHVLDIGCGTSALGPCIYKHSECAVRVTCADISPVAVRLMQEHAESTPVQPCNPFSTLVFQEMDCTELEGHFGAQSLALIVDKGTTDALVRSKQGQSKAGQIVRQCLKVLKPSGHLLQFSDEDPDARLLWLEKESRGSEVLSQVGVHEIGELRGVTYFCYQISPCIAHH
ncbi:citrate synthase-lysine N-methyltransferase CSKMT, mitochondrial [Salminus brasiliensis]|uniref:citrate synthase-lysine N-methyltransferase CSKMT, mitochondrial n=1 Tax=Salminus brasiliensis TaxID=930266 RepID=UPI003B83339E